MNNLTYINRCFRFVYTPKVELGFDKKRFLVGYGQISKYITKENAINVEKSLQNMRTDKITLKFRKWGKIEIYVK